MKSWLFIAIAGVVLMTGACSKTFLVYKDGKSYFLDGSAKSKYDLLCASGDMEKVLAETELETMTKDDLYKFSCSEESSNENLRQLYASLTVVQRKDIKKAFRKNGYEINKMAC
jgi:hypothetical protein